jgi:hypothetical protein
MLPCKLRNPMPCSISIRHIADNPRAQIVKHHAASAHSSLLAHEVVHIGPDPDRLHPDQSRHAMYNKSGVTSSRISEDIGPAYIGPASHRLSFGLKYCQEHSCDKLGLRQGFTKQFIQPRQAIWLPSSFHITPHFDPNLGRPQWHWSLERQANAFDKSCS